MILLMSAVCALSIVRSRPMASCSSTVMGRGAFIFDNWASWWSQNRHSFTCFPWRSLVAANLDIRFSILSLKRAAAVSVMSSLRSFWTFQYSTMVALEISFHFCDLLFGSTSLQLQEDAIRSDHSESSSERGRVLKFALLSMVMCFFKMPCRPCRSSTTSSRAYFSPALVAFPFLFDFLAKYANRSAGLASRWSRSSLASSADSKCVRYVVRCFKNMKNSYGDESVCIMKTISSRTWAIHSSGRSMSLSNAMYLAIVSVASDHFPVPMGDTGYPYKGSNHLVI